MIKHKLLNKFSTYHNINNILIPLLTIFLTLPLFFYKFSQSSLISWDEAWYGDIARNILKTGDLWNLYWNGGHFFDHPPAGFWLIALSEKFFGVSEFSVRFIPAISGFLTLILVFFLGKKLFNTVVGLISAIALSSTTWFILRARSGDLDTILTLFFVLTVYLAFKARENKYFLMPFLVSFFMLLLTKTMVPFTLIPALIIIFWGQKTYKLKDLVLPMVFFFGLLLYWLYNQLVDNPQFIIKYFQIGLPGVTVKTSFVTNFNVMKQYLHDGIGRWFWPGVLGIIVGLILKQKRIYIMLIFCLSFFLPFIFSNRGGIWHLIPLYPFMILAFFSVSYEIFSVVVKNKFIISILIIGFGLLVSLVQIKQNWIQFIDIPAYVSDEAILSKLAGEYPQRFYIEDDFVPAAVFYSGKNVEQIHDYNLISLFEAKDDFLLITKQSNLDQDAIPKTEYRILKQDRDKILVLKSN